MSRRDLWLGLAGFVPTALLIALAAPIRLALPPAAF